MTVGEVAKAIGVTSRAIRLWEAKGLGPDVVRTPARYRLYDAADLGRLRFIRRATALGMRLGEIKRILGLQRAGTPPCDCVAAMLEQRIAEIDRTLSELTALRQTLLTARARADAAPPRTDTDVVCHLIEPWEEPRHDPRHPHGDRR
jgi:DNA-binding transcriptional MerR regulator